MYEPVFDIFDSALKVFIELFVQKGLDKINALCKYWKNLILYLFFYMNSHK